MQWCGRGRVCVRETRESQIGRSGGNAYGESGHNNGAARHCHVVCCHATHCHHYSSVLRAYITCVGAAVLAGCAAVRTVQWSSACHTGHTVQQQAIQIGQLFASSIHTPPIHSHTRRQHEQPARHGDSTARARADNTACSQAHASLRAAGNRASAYNPASALLSLTPASHHPPSSYT